MGVDVLVSAPHTIAQLIEEQVAVGDLVELLQLAEGKRRCSRPRCRRTRPSSGAW